MPSTKRAQLVRLAEAQNWRCCWCGVACDVDEPRGRPTSATTEHVVPQGQGGTNRIENRVMACLRCNQDRADLPAGRYLKRLKNRARRARQKLARREGVGAVRESCGGVESRHAVEAGKTKDQRIATGAPGSVDSAVLQDRVSAVGDMHAGVTVPTAGVAPGPHDTFAGAQP